MLFGTYIQQPDVKPVKELEVGTEHDLADDLAQALIGTGRAETLAPAPSKGKK